MVEPTPIRHFETFAPDMAATLGRAFDDAWRSLQENGTDLSSSMTRDAVREALALRIISMAQRGERDAARLRDGALCYLVAEANRKQA